jgi:hypothetical protein
MNPHDTFWVEPATRAGEGSAHQITPAAAARRRAKSPQHDAGDFMRLKSYADTAVWNPDTVDPIRSRGLFLP